MRTITVSCRSFDQRSFGIQKYSNGDSPPGVHPLRFLRKTTPSTDQLTALATWLVENLPGCVAGMQGPMAGSKVRVYSDKTMGDMAGKPGWNDMGTLKIYDMVDKPVRIDDWLFSQIDPKQNDEDYWNKEAMKMIDAGGVKIVVTGSQSTAIAEHTVDREFLVK